jgi:hypothetical protein
MITATVRHGKRCRRDRSCSIAEVIEWGAPTRGRRTRRTKGQLRVLSNEGGVDIPVTAPASFPPRSIEEVNVMVGFVTV